MRFAILGNHPDGLELASALAESGRHQVRAYTGASVPEALRRRWGPEARPVGDLEEVLADPAIDALVVAGTPANRPAQLRRSLQSERHVLCVHPADRSPDIAYEAAMIQADTRKVLLPVLPDALHPAVRRLAELLRHADSPVGPLMLLALERCSPEPILLGTALEHKPAFPGWDVLRAVAGEIAEVAALAVPEELTGAEPVLVSGRFDKGCLFQVTLLPRQPEERLRLIASGSRGRAELFFPLGWHGPAYLSWREPSGQQREEAWGIWDPWPSVVAVFDAAVAGAAAAAPTWQDEVRALELDDAARRGVERRRSTVMEYPEATEEVGFKGTMTLAGCGLLWGLLVLVIVANWYPLLFWAIGPLLVLFLGLQLLRWVVPGAREQSTKRDSA